MTKHQVYLFFSDLLPKVTKYHIYDNFE